MKHQNYLEFNLSKIIVLAFVFLLYYSLFIFFGNFIHSTYTNMHLTKITPWLVGASTENDGIEFWIMSITMPIYLLFCFFLTSNYFVKYNISLTKYQNLFTKNLCYAVLSAILIIFLGLHVSSKNLNFKFEDTFFLLLVIFLLIISSYYLSKFKFPKSLQIILFTLLFIIVFIITILVSSSASIFDYCFFIGPANKLMQGDIINSFFMQYNLLGTSFFVVMQKFNLKIHEFQIVLAGIFSIWVILYTFLSKKMFSNKFLIPFFIIVFILIKCFAIIGGPTPYPQVLPYRLDLWVPIVIFIYYFKLESIYVSLLISVCYLLDDVFGLMYLLLYAIFIIGLYYKNQCRLVKKIDSYN